MKRYVPLDAILSADVEQEIINLVMEQKKNFTQRQILEKVKILFPFVAPKELDEEVTKVLFNFRQVGTIKVYAQACTPDKENIYIINK